MNRVFPTRITEKVNAIIIGISFLGMLSVSLLFLYANVHDLEKSRREQIRLLMNVMSSNLAQALLFDDLELGVDLLNTIHVVPSLVKVQLYSKESDFHITHVYPSQAHMLPSSLTLQDIRLSNHIGVKHDPNDFFQHVDLFSDPNHLDVFEDLITVSNEPVGRIVAYFSPMPMIHRTRRMVLEVFCVLIASLGITFLISRRLQKAISEPILALHRVSSRVFQEKDYSIRAKVESHDEVGQLTIAYNQMLDYIQNRDQELEKKVKLRTQEISELADQFKYRAFHDELTGLPNRAMFTEHLSDFVQSANPKLDTFAVILIDLDNFKVYNDTWGHVFGDELLKNAADRVQSILDSHHVLYRIGGDEFIILFPLERNSQEIFRVSRFILHELKQSVMVDDRRVELRCSIGACVYPDHGVDIMSLKKSAEIAMYHAKDQGKNQFVLFKKSMEDETLQRLIVQNDISTAIESGQIEIYFQPKVNGRNAEIIGCEVLVRWEHPEYGLLTPDRFIPYAEDVGLIRHVDYYVLNQACYQAKVWSNELDEPLSVAVNLSGMHFKDSDIVSEIKNVLAKHALPANLLEIELTEAILIKDPDRALLILAELSQLGVSIALDDFGMGYSSLNYLRTLPIDTLKLDKSFIANVLTNAHDQRITKGIIALAKGLDLKLVAEGIEEVEQQEFLLNHGCDFMQGYYFSNPCQLSEFEQWMMDYQRTNLSLNKL